MISPRNIFRRLIEHRWLLVAIVFVAVAGGIASELADARKPWIVQEKVDARAVIGKPPSIRSYREIWVWYGAAGSALVFLILGATARWWARPAKIDLGAAPLFGNGARVRKFGLILVAITAIAAVPRVARMDLSFWGDEDWSLHSHVWGEFSEQDDGSLEFERHPWTTTVFYNPRGNNHVFQSMLSKLCLEGWNTLRGYGDDHIEEWTTRAPSLIAGLLGIVAIALWLRELGHPLAGLIAAATLAVHPNHLRYSSEARGYGLAMMFLTLSSWMLCRALRRDSRWRHWILFALFQALALLSFTASIYVLLALNASIAALLLIRYRKDSAGGALEALKRWFVVNSVTGCAYATVALPTTMQTLRFMESSLIFAWKMSATHYQMLWSRVFTGFDFAASHPANPVDVGLAVTTGGLAVLVLFTVLFCCALKRVIQDFGWNAVLLVAPVVAALLALAHGAAKGHAVFPQYFLPSFPAAVALFALLLERIGGRLARALSNSEGEYSSTGWGVAPAIVALGLFTVVCWKGLTVLVTQPVENLRGAAEMTRWRHGEEPYADESKAIVVSLWRSWEMYDPRLRSNVRAAAELEAVIAEARAEQKELYVVVGHIALAERENSDMLTMLRDPEMFEPMDTLWAPELFVSLWPYRLK